MEVYLDSLRPGMQAVVTQICCSERLRRRLADFGLVPGTRVGCRYRSPDQNLSAIALRGAVLAIRRTDLEKIAVRLL